MAVNPIRPSDAVDAKRNRLPDGVMEAFNDAIADNLRNGRSVVKQDDLIARIQKKLNDPLGNQYTESEIIDSGWLDVEPIFRKAGWKVEYNRPDYTENHYDSYFEFSMKSKR